MQLCSNKHFLNEIKIWIHCKKKKKKLTKIWYPQFPMSKQYILKQGKRIYFIIKSIHSLFLLSFGKWQHSGISKSSQSEGKIFEGNSCLENPMDGGAWWAAVHEVTQSWTGLSDFTFTFHFHVLEKEMATHSSVLAWRIPGTGEPGGLPSMGSHRVGHDGSDLAAAAAAGLPLVPAPITPHQQPPAPPRSLGND